MEETTFNVSSMLECVEGPLVRQLKQLVNYQICFHGHTVHQDGGSRYNRVSYRVCSWEWEMYVDALNGRMRVDSPTTVL